MKNCPIWSVVLALTLTSLKINPGELSQEHQIELEKQAGCKREKCEWWITPTNSSGMCAITRA